jgi:hypothetical protein
MGEDELLMQTRDQELRFTVHDSPDYYQLKVSVFNDDKKTDLIGETWVDLKKIVVPGGGQQDTWFNLNCRGKYAGEIRIEITYYDTRPKVEKPRAREVVSSTQQQQDGENGREAMAGPRQPKPVVKRRPLPADPITGAAASPTPVSTPEHVQQQPARAYHTPPTHIQHQSPLQAMEYHTPTHRSSYAQLPRSSQGQRDVGYGQQQGMTGQAPAPAGREVQDERYDMYNPDDYGSNVGSNVGSNLSSRYDEAYASNVSSNVGSNVGSINSARYDEAYGSAVGSNVSSRHEDSYNNHSGSNVGSNVSNRYDDPYYTDRGEPRAQHNYQQPAYELPNTSKYEAPLNPEGPPPPPPVHRTNPAASHNTGYGYQQQPVPSEPLFDDLRQDTYRHSMPAYTQNESYQSYNTPKRGQYAPLTQQSPPEMNGYYQQQQSPEANNYQQSPPRHHSYDARYHTSNHSLQPTVEDEPVSPESSYTPLHRNTEPLISACDNRRYDQVQAPAPLNLGGRGNSPAYQNTNTSSGYNSYNELSKSTGSIPNPTYKDNQLPSYNTPERQSYSNNTVRQISEKPWQPEDQLGSSPPGPSNYLPPVPPTLMAGMDPTLAQELSDRIYSESRANYKNSSMQSRRRYSEVPQQRAEPQQYREEPSADPFVPPVASYDERQSRMITNTYTSVIKPRAISPAPSVARKSVSPAPPPSEAPPRRLSGIPFGPDDYSALNPNIPVAATSAALFGTSTPDTVDPDAKIILHDGREVDPSDHLPEQTWAALPPNLKKSFDNPTSSATRSRPSPGGAHPMPATQRLQQRGRPQSFAAPQSSPMYMGGTASDPSTPAPTSRNRLQKKFNRPSAQPAPHSSPPVPISSYQDNSFVARGPPPRARTMDFGAENGFGAGGYHSNPGYRGTPGPAQAPPVPAKIPVQHAPPPPLPIENSWLEQEIASIDIGNGPSRRRGQTHAGYA